MKLFIDDIRNAPDDSWIVVRTVTGAIRALATMEVDVISLDHDIAHHVSVDGNSRSFACAQNALRADSKTGSSGLAPVFYTTATCYRNAGITSSANSRIDSRTCPCASPPKFMKQSSEVMPASCITRIFSRHRAGSPKRTTFCSKS